MITEPTFDTVRLTTPRLMLREIEESDTGSLRSYWSDPEVTRYMPNGVVSEKGVRDLVQRALAGRGSRPRRDFRLAVTLKESGMLVGEGVCRVADPGSREVLAGIIGPAYVRYYLGGGS